MSNDASSVLSESASPILIEPRGSKRSNESEELNFDNKKSRIVIIDGDDEADVVKDKSVSNVNISNSIDADPCSSRSDDKFHCTACDKVAVEVHPHPLLKVIICKDCKYLMEEKMLLKVWA